MEITQVGVDLAKNVFQLNGVDRTGKTVWKRTLSRVKWIKELTKHVKPGATIGMEACTGAHHWGRILLEKGYQVKIIPPQFVTPFVKSNKNDLNDAQAICEAMNRPNMHPVQIKSIEQQDLQALHRIREEIKSHRVAKVNHIRGLVSEYGLVAPQKIPSLRKAIINWLDDSNNGLSSYFKQLLQDLWQDLCYLDQRMEELDYQVQEVADNHPMANKLQQLRGIGPITATAIIATIGDGKQYRNGRDMAAAIGLVPRQHSSGGKSRLLKISKRGDSYLRCLLVHGGRSVMRTVKNKEDRLSCWVKKLQQRRHHNVVAVAIANKLARTAWALMTKEEDYDPNYSYKVC